MRLLNAIMWSTLTLCALSAFDYVAVGTVAKTAAGLIDQVTRVLP